MNCTICNAPLDPRGVCPNCGFDLGQNYEQYPTLVALAGMQSLSARRKALTQKDRDHFCCPDCKRDLFSVHLMQSAIICASCGHIIPLQDLLQQKQSQQESDTIQWTLNAESGTLSIRGSGEIGDYQAHGAPWDDLKPQIRSVVVGTGVTGIGSNAFSYCAKLMRVTLPSSVKRIGVNAFQYCTRLRSLEIPAGVEQIEDRAFQFCTELQVLRLPASLTALGSDLLRGCDQLHSIYFAGSKSLWASLRGNIIAQNLPGVKVFLEDGLSKEVLIPFRPDPNPLRIETGGDRINWYYFPEDETMTVSGQGKMQHYRPGKAPGYKFQKRIRKIILKPGVETIGDFAFSSLENVESVVISDGIRRIGSNAFEHCGSIREIQFSKNLLHIGSGAFMYCSSLSRLTLPDGITSIDNHAFQYCYDLQEIWIPDTVTQIGNSAFSCCDNLRNVFYGGTKSQWDSIAIGKGNLALTTASLHFSARDAQVSPSSSGNDGVPENKSASIEWRYDDNSRTLTISGNGKMEDFSEETIPWKKNLLEIRTVIVEQGVTGIGSYAFKGCTGLGKLILHPGLESIGAYAFKYCSSLRQIALPPELSSIGVGAFQYCTRLSELELPQGLQRVGTGAFQYCTDLKQVKVPESIISIGDIPFLGCDRMQDIYYAGNEARWGMALAGGRIGSSAAVHYMTV